MSVALEARDLLLVRGERGSRFELRVEALDLVKGEVLAVLGPNGAGKSTLLRALAELAPPERGRIVKRSEGRSTMVFQRPLAFAGSVGHNVRVALRAQRMSKAETARRCHAALQRFGIADLSERRATALSGGELRRLALARAFALEPSVLLLDEPFDDLDPAAQGSLSRDLRRVVAETGVAVAVVTHDLQRAALVCDRIAVLVGGDLRQVGLRDEVLCRPVDVDVARLVGMQNLLPARVESPGTAAVENAHPIPMTEGGWEIGSAVWLGLRPEHLKVDIGRGEGESIGKGHVHECVTDGVLSTLIVQWGEHRLRTHLVAGRGLARQLVRGDVVSLSVRPGDVHLMPRS